MRRLPEIGVLGVHHVAGEVEQALPAAQERARLVLGDGDHAGDLLAPLGDHDLAAVLSQCLEQGQAARLELADADVHTGRLHLTT
jgi:hypothetical protein